VTKHLTLGLPIVDFDNVKDAFWKQLLRGRIDQFDSPEFPSKDIDDVFDEVKEYLGTSTTPWGVATVPLYFDRILGHAGITLKTSIMNNLHVPLISKLTRLCKVFARDVANVSGFDILQAMRKGVSDKDLPEQTLKFVREVRAFLDLNDGSVLYDDSSFKSQALLNTSWLMQNKFNDFGVRKNIIMPVFAISRAHIRLDATHLYTLAHTLMPPPHPHPKPDKKDFSSEEEFDKAMSDYKTSLKKPSKKNFESNESYCAAVKKFNKLQEKIKNYEEAMKEYKDENPSLTTVKKDKPQVPKNVVASKFPNPDPSFPNKKPPNVPADEWKKMRKEHEEKMAPYRLAVHDFKASEEYKELERKYEEYTRRVNEGAIKLFKPFKDKSAKAGWVPSGSITTDGVSLCIAYERTIQTSSTKETSPASPMQVDDSNNYDPSDPTFVGNQIVAGVDTGRTNIANTVCVDKERKKHKWNLSRQQYYAESGIWVESKKQEKEYKPLTNMLKDRPEDAVLRATHHDQVKSYIKWSASVEEVWWKLALARRTSRRKMRLYSQKKSTLASYWHNVNKGLCALKDSEDQEIQIAYGSAYKSMKTNGRGEITVPTTAVFSSCKREFGPQNVTPEWEHKSTKVSFDTKKAKEAAYKMISIVDGKFKETLCHTPSKYMPYVHDENIEAMQKYKEERSLRAKRRRGGTIPWKKENHNFTQSENERMRYIECRGLRFCPETRMYYDRDASAARAIAGLRCIAIQGRARPIAFC
jgi:hypothetical protein